MALNSFKAIGHAMEKVGATVSSTVTGAGATLLHTTSDATHAGGEFVSRTFHLAVKEAEEELKAVNNQIQRVADSEEGAILRSSAGKKVREYEDIIQELVTAWPKVLLSHGAEVDVLRHSASQKHMKPQAATAMKRIVSAPELRDVLHKAYDRSFVSFAIEFGGSVAAVASVDGALGFVTEIKSMSNVKRYGSVGLSLGASAGGAGDVALGLFTSSPQNYGGSFVAVTMESAVGIGGGIVVSFDFPDLMFGGFSIPVAVGEKVNVSVGGGYTFTMG